MTEHSPIRAVTVVTNPRSGHGKGGDVASAAGARFRAAGVEVTEVCGASPAESVRQIRDSIAGGSGVQPDAVVCIGGDGLINVTLAAVAETGVALGMIPAGTGNDLARELGVPTDDDFIAQHRGRRDQQGHQRPGRGDAELHPRRVGVAPELGHAAEQP